MSGSPHFVMKFYGAVADKMDISGIELCPEWDEKKQETINSRAKCEIVHSFMVIYTAY